MRASAWIIRGLPQTKPIRQPGMLYDFDSEKISTPTSLAPGHLEERGRPVAVVGEVRVGEVVHDHQLVLAREVDDLHEEVAVHAERGRVVREGQDQQLGLGPRPAAPSPVSRAKKSSPGISGTERRSPSAMTTE